MVKKAGYGSMERKLPSRQQKASYCSMNNIIEIASHGSIESKLAKAIWKEG